MAAGTLGVGEGLSEQVEGGMEGEQWHAGDKDIRRREPGRRRRNERKMRKWKRDEGWESQMWVRKRVLDKEAVFCALTILIHGFPQISKALSICPNEP